MNAFSHSFCPLSIYTTSLRRAVAVLSALALMAASASAQVIANYAANADPTTEGFGLWPYNGGIATTALSNDQGLAAFQIQNTGANNEQAYYEMLGGTGPYNAQGSGLTSSQASEISTQGFTLSLQARVVQGPASGSTDVFSVNATVAGFNGFRYDIDLGSDGSSNTVVVLPTQTAYAGGQFTGTGGVAPLVLTGTGYHLYQLSYNPSSGMATLYVDGIARENGYAGSSVSSGATANNYGVAFGVANNATGNFADVQLAIGQINPATGIAPGFLSSPDMTGGQFGFTVSGTAGLNYIVQSSTNLASAIWIPIITNSVPFALWDTNTSAPQQFFRAIPQ
jgi:hypothetical protein